MDKEIFDALAADTSKIFALDIIEADLAVENFFEQFHKKLSDHIFDLLQRDYNQLLIILYRIDVDENVLKNCLEDSGIFNVADCLADAIIERLIKKIKFRRGFNQ
jgi:hypothetical protein